jgi:hypothetical protein
VQFSRHSLVWFGLATLLPQHVFPVFSSGACRVALQV